MGVCKQSIRYAGPVISTLACLGHSEVGDNVANKTAAFGDAEEVDVEGFCRGEGLGREVVGVGGAFVGHEGEED